MGPTPREQHLVWQYERVRARFDLLTRELQDIFMPKLKRAMRHRNYKKARDLIRRCPDNVIRAFMMDQLVAGLHAKTCDWNKTGAKCTCQADLREAKL